MRPYGRGRAGSPRTSLSALSRALKKGALDAFKAEWLSADRIGGDEG